MMHATEGTLIAFLDGELPEPGRAKLERHLGSCALCAADVDFLRRASVDFASAMELLDEPPPAVELTTSAVVRRSKRHVWGWEVGRSLRRAAILVLGVAGVASAAIPGSPVHRWVHSLREQVAPLLEPADTRSTETTTPSGRETGSPAGVSILPVDGRVGVVLRDAAPGVEVRVRLTEGPRAAVRTAGDANARFRISPGRIEVVGMAGGTLHIELPRGVRSAAVRIGGEPYLVKDGAQLRVLAPAADTVGAEVIFQIAP